MSSLEFDEDVVSQEEVSPADVLKRMTEAWMNESASPTLLPHQFDLVDILVDQSEHMTANIARVPEAHRRDLKCTVHEMELHRISYVINSYLRYVSLATLIYRLRHRFNIWNSLLERG